MLTANTATPQHFGAPVAVSFNRYFYMESLIENYSRQLWCFMRTTLVPAVPELAWWALGLMGFSGLNLLFLTELWPHHPKAEDWFTILLIASLALLPWLVAYTAQRLMGQLRRWWRGFWWLVAAGACLAAAISSIILLIGTLVSMDKWLR